MHGLGVLQLGGIMELAMRTQAEAAQPRSTGLEIPSGPEATLARMNPSTLSTSPELHWRCAQLA